MNSLPSVSLILAEQKVWRVIKKRGHYESLEKMTTREHSPTNLATYTRGRTHFLGQKENEGRPAKARGEKESVCTRFLGKKCWKKITLFFSEQKKSWLKTQLIGDTFPNLKDQLLILPCFVPTNFSALPTLIMLATLPPGPWNFLQILPIRTPNHLFFLVCQLFR